MPCDHAAKKQKRFRLTFIRDWRKYRKLTLDQLGEKIDMTASNLSMLETGKRGYTQETLEAIADALMTDVASLLARAPQDSEDLWSTWATALPGEKETIAEVARSIVKRRDRV